MKNIVLFALCASVAVANAQFMPKHEVPTNSPLGKLRAKQKLQSGGDVVKPGTQKGVFLIADAQNVIPATNFTAMAAGMSAQSGFNFKYAKVDAPANLAWGEIAKKHGAAFVIGIVADDNLPMTLVAQEANWALVNVKKCGENLTGNARELFFASRARKGILKAYAQLCAVYPSKFGYCVLLANKPADLDRYHELLPIDVLQDSFKRLSAMGLSPVKRTSYRQACIEGWAKNPTNALQKAVWDDVHSLPTKPITIEPEK